MPASPDSPPPPPPPPPRALGLRAQELLALLAARAGDLESPLERAAEPDLARRAAAQADRAGLVRAELDRVAVERELALVVGVVRVEREQHDGVGVVGDRHVVLRAQPPGPALGADADRVVLVGMDAERQRRRGDLAPVGARDDADAQVPPPRLRVRRARRMDVDLDLLLVRSGGAERHEVDRLGHDRVPVARKALHVERVVVDDRVLVAHEREDARALARHDGDPERLRPGVGIVVGQPQRDPGQRTRGLEGAGGRAAVRAAARARGRDARVQERGRGRAGSSRAATARGRGARARAGRTPAAAPPAASARRCAPDRRAAAACGRPGGPRRRSATRAAGSPAAAGAVVRSWPSARGSGSGFCRRLLRPAAARGPRASGSSSAPSAGTRRRRRNRRRRRAPVRSSGRFSCVPSVHSVAFLGALIRSR